MSDMENKNPQGKRPEGATRRPAGSRPSGSRPSGQARPAGSRPAGSRPAGARPSGERRPNPSREPERNAKSGKTPKKKNSALTIVLRVLAVIGVTLGMVLFFLIGICFILTHGPSDTAKGQFVLSAKETSALKWVPGIFLSDDEIKEITESRGMIEIAEGTQSDQDLVQIETNTDVEEVGEPIEVVDVKGESYRGKLLIIKDPSRVYLGTVPQFFEGSGETVTTMAERLGAVAGINGGEFLDMGSYSYTALPVGGVIKGGKVIHGGLNETSNFTGITYDNKLVIGNMTAQEALDAGVRDAVNTLYTTGPFLILDGELLTVPDTSVYGGGKNPRTAIGQRADGAILMLVVDGRQANSIGATFAELAYIMKEYGAVNAAAMDGGTSTQMYYDGEIINKPYSPTGPRKCPTAWLVAPEN